jgi:hypothetical protein
MKTNQRIANPVTGAEGNMLPTKYREISPKEDLSEPVKLFIYDPQQLKAMSIKRYNFLRDQCSGNRIRKREADKNQVETLLPGLDLDFGSCTFNRDERSLLGVIQC